MRAELRFGLVLVLASLCGMLAGCQSVPEGTPSGHAAVVLTGNTPGQITETAVQLCIEDGYTVASQTLSHAVLERQGSSLENVAYGNWLETGVWIRLRISVVTLGPETYRLQAQRFVVRDRGSTTEEEVKGSRRAAQDLLDRVALKLAPPKPEKK